MNTTMTVQVPTDTLLSQKLASDLLMLAGIAPFFVVMGFLATTFNAKGDDALGAVFAAAIGYGITYVLTLSCAFPAALWSYRLSKKAIESRYASIARAIVIVIMASPFLLCALAALYLALAHLP